MKLSVFFLGIFGFFSIIFNGIAPLGMLIVSAVAVIIGSSIFISTLNKMLNKWVLLGMIIISISGSFYDVYSYFSVEHAVGNSYGAWILLIPINLIHFFILYDSWHAKNKE